jgi:hypothetical protein
MAWIARHRLTGILTEYLVGDGCYDLAIREGHFVLSRSEHGTPPHVARFAPSRTTHIHVRDGEEDDHSGWAVIPTRCTNRLCTSTTNSTYTRVRPTVSTVKKSVASRPLAWVRRKSLQGPVPPGCRFDPVAAQDPPY